MALAKQVGGKAIKLVSPQGCLPAPATLRCMILGIVRNHAPLTTGNPLGLWIPPLHLTLITH